MIDTVLSILFKLTQSSQQSDSGSNLTIFILQAKKVKHRKANFPKVH